MKTAVKEYFIMNAFGEIEALPSLPEGVDFERARWTLSSMSMSPGDSGVTVKGQKESSEGWKDFSLTIWIQGEDSKRFIQSLINRQWPLYLYKHKGAIYFPVEE